MWIPNFALRWFGLPNKEDRIVLKEIDKAIKQAENLKKIYSRPQDKKHCDLIIEKLLETEQLYKQQHGLK